MEDYLIMLSCRGKSLNNKYYQYILPSFNLIIFLIFKKMEKTHFQESSLADFFFLLSEPSFACLLTTTVE